MNQPVSSTGANSGVPASARRATSGDMSEEDWDGLKNGLAKFLEEEEREPEHAGDDTTKRPTMSKAEANYVDGWPDESTRCDRCTMFQQCRNKMDVHRCTLVKGDISLRGHCNRFDASADARRTLYAYRPLKNAGDLIAWARKAGFKKTLPAKDMHVTIAYSREPLHWPDLEGGPVAAPDASAALNGTRSVELLGDEGAVVLRFECPELSDRWHELRDAGASWDYDDYRPHVTFTMDGGDIDLDKVEPYAGPLEFGPEMFDELNDRDGWADKARKSMIGTDEVKHFGAGIIFMDPEGKVLFLKRNGAGEHPGHWDLPGGSAKDGEQPHETALREAAEETGNAPKLPLKLMDRSDPSGLAVEHEGGGKPYFATFAVETPRFEPTLSDEHEAHVWAHPKGDMPQPLLPGTASTLARMGEAEDGALDRKPPDQAEHVATVKYDGDFNMKGLLQHLHALGTMGASRTVTAMDGDDQPVKFGWDGDGADKILAAEVDGVDVLADSAEDAKDKAFDMALDRALRLAFDRESVRTKDRDGRLRVEMTNISKANICPYRGDEIPNYEELGLEPERIYKLYRDPQELAKAAPTFNGVQLLRKHVPVDADDHRKYDIVGTTGTDAIFEAPYLRNSLIVWSQEGIDLIESEQQKELSAGYHYKADMTPGAVDGEAYDGVMREIHGNHVALVSEGRAGSDVVVGDSADGIEFGAIAHAITDVYRHA